MSIRAEKQRLRSAGSKSVVMTTRYPLDHPGGVESVARALADSLSKSGESWKVSHVAAYPGRVGFARLPLIGDLVAGGRLAAQVMGKGDVLLVHGAEYAWGPMVVGRLTGRPIVTVWHGVRGNEVIPPTQRRIGKVARGFFLWSQGLLQGAALRADATVAVSPAVAAQVQSRYGFRGQIMLIPNGVTIESGRRHDDERISAASNGGPLGAIWVGTSAYQKGLDRAVGAGGLARARGQDVSLTVVGIPVESAGLELASGGSWLTALGAVPPSEMEALYRRHDILLFPTRYEAFGLVALEAMAAGLPVIGSSVVRSLIEGAGEVVVGDYAEAYAEALRALADPERRRLLGRVGMERARAFSWETSTASYLEVLNVVARDRGHQHRHQGRRM